jgi:hypothetical protein
VALELADDRRHRVGREVAAAVGVEAVDRVDEADARDLDEVVERLGAAVVAAGEPAGERQEALDELIAGGDVAEAGVPAEQPLYPRGSRVDGGGRRGALRRRGKGGRRNGDRPPGTSGEQGLAGGA